MNLRLLAILLVLPAVIMAEDNRMPSIQYAKKKHEADLLRMPGVVSVGIGLDDVGNQAIVVGLMSPDPRAEARIPERLEGHPVVVRIVGPIQTQGQ